MTTATLYCPQCGQPVAHPVGRYCSHCGELIEHRSLNTQPQDPSGVQTTMTAPASNPRSPYSSGLINSTRLLAALCMVSGIFAVVQLDSRTTPGRILIAASILVSLLGQIFISQATKPVPASWASSVLTLFWGGLVALGVLWLVIP